MLQSKQKSLPSWGLHSSEEDKQQTIYIVTDEDECYENSVVTAR